MLSYIIVQKYLIFLIGVMVSTAIMKKHNLMADMFKFIIDHIPSKRGAVALISFVGGMLPIPGRVTVSAGILSGLAPCCSDADCNIGDKQCQKSRSKFGIIDYLATHHYYLWSPLEKTVILPMAALGLSWGAFIGYMWPLIVITGVYITWYIFYKFQEEDIQINSSLFGDYNYKRLFTGFLPLIGGIALLATGLLNGAWIFGFLTLYYVVLTKSFNIKELSSYVNWKLVFLLSGVLMLSVFFKSHSVEILQLIETYKSFLDITTMSGMIAISGFAFFSSWLMGSSGKYAGIVALLVTIYGPQYLVWFLALEFFAYNVSPMHKCIHIGRMYFNTPVRKYFEVIILWQFFLMSWAAIYTFFI